MPIHLPNLVFARVAARGRPAARGMASAMIPRQTPDASLGRVLGAEAARGRPPHRSATGGHGNEGPKTTTRPQVMRAREGELKQEEGQAGPWPHNPAILTIVAVANDCKAARGRLHDHFASYQI